MSAQSDRIVRLLEQALLGVQNELAAELEAEVREAMPVDTGFARANVEVRVEHDLALDGSISFVVTDVADYVQRLNDGSSPQAEPEFIEHAAERAFETVEARMATRKVDL